MSKCPSCNGRGTIVVMLQISEENPAKVGIEGTCDTCNGTGKVKEPGVCAACNGSGTAVVMVRIGNSGRSAGIEGDCERCNGTGRR